jgi:imidazolonepropionase-like amidohydrolase
MGGKGPIEVKEKVLEVINEGISDWIGLNITGGFTSNQPRVMKRNYKEVSMAVNIAHKYGKKVDATLENAEGCKIGVEADVDCITHGMLIDEECLEMMNKKDIFWSPILLTRAVSCEMDLNIPDSDVNMSGLPMPKKLEWIQEMKNNLKVLKKHVRIGYEMGLKILSGSDIPPPRTEAVIISNDSLIREVEMVRDWTGMSDMEALMTATKYCGECLEMPIGTLEKGKLADLCITCYDPIFNIRKALDPSNIYMTIKDGNIIHLKN